MQELRGFGVSGPNLANIPASRYACIMKASSLLLALVVFAAAGSGALASDKAKTPRQQKKAPNTHFSTTKSKAPASAPKQVVATGSYIKRKIHRSGYITDGPYPLYVIDSQSIHESGASDLRQLLARPGLNR
jgi:hypothetical protein